MADLDNAQLITLGNSIRGNPAVWPSLSNDATGIAAWYNVPDNQSPTVFVFVQQITREQLIANLDWVNEYADGFKDDAPTLWPGLFAGTYEPRSTGARNALNTILSGAPTSKSAILAIAWRHATPMQALYAVPPSAVDPTGQDGPGGGNGNNANNSAIDITSDGQTTTENVQQALSLTGP